MKIITTGSDFSGVGAFDYTIERVCEAKGLNHKRIFACDWDKFARITYTHNHGEPAYYPKDVYDREIPIEPLDVYMTSPPCQAFSIAGKRKGKEDERGILFFNSHEFIQKNKPRYFIFENVKGLLSDDNGKTFREWINYLGGKSVNGNPVIFPDENSVPYHIYWKVINTKDHGVPQNRERVFIIGIRDDEDNDFRFPKEEYLETRLKDVLEPEVDKKYFLSEKAINGLLSNSDRHKEKGNGFGATISDDSEVSNTIRARYYKDGSEQLLKVGTWRTHKDGEGFREIKDGTCPTIPARAREDGSGQPVIQIKTDEVIQINESKESGGKQPYQGNRVYSFKGVSPALSAQQGGKSKGSILTCIPVSTPDRENKSQNGRRFKEDGDPSFTITTQDRHGIYDGYLIRRLTPRECFRLQDFPDTFDFSVVSDTQAYKQAGNSITVRVLEKILMKLQY